MKVYYFNQSTGGGVEADSPGEMDYEEALLNLRRLRGTGSFLGVEIGGGEVLQFRYEEGCFWMEILDTGVRLASGCQVAVPMAEQALAAVFAREDVREAMKRQFPWMTWTDVRV